MFINIIIAIFIQVMFVSVSLVSHEAKYSCTHRDFIENKIICNYFSPPGATLHATVALRPLGVQIRSQQRAYIGPCPVPSHARTNLVLRSQI